MSSKTAESSSTITTKNSDSTLYMETSESSTMSSVTKSTTFPALDKYCSVPMCTGKVHIACNNTGVNNIKENKIFWLNRTFQEFSSICDSPVQVDFTEAQLSQILHNFNYYRNMVALGEVPAFSTARRMGKLVWNEELAFFAELNTKQCSLVNFCLNSQQFLIKFSPLRNMMLATACHLC